MLYFLCAFYQFRRVLFFLKPSCVFSFFIFLLSSGAMATHAFALEVKLHPSLLTAQGNYPIDAQLLYEMKTPGLLVPKKSFTGPVIHLDSLPAHFNPCSAPRFIFREKEASVLSTRLKNLYFAAAPNGELYPADAPHLSSSKIKNDMPLSYPVPDIGRPYQKAELEDWRWYPYLMEALRLALEARHHGDHPFGAVLVVKGKILIRGLNTVNTTQDFTAHAERNLESLSGKLPAAIRSNAVLVTSTEPCAMCAGGCVWTGVGTIVYGLSAPGLGAITGSDSFFVPSRELLSHAKKPIKIMGPLFEPIAAMVHQGFWR